MITAAEMHGTDVMVTGPDEQGRKVARVETAAGDFFRFYVKSSEPTTRRGHPVIAQCIKLGARGGMKGSAL